jgi:hypothetical protein
VTLGRPSCRLESTSYTFNFVGAQPGRGRVWAVNGSGMPGAKSGWRQFGFTQ